MATDSKRKDSLQLMVAALQTVNGSGSYHYSLSSSRQVSLGFDDDGERLAQNDITIRVYDGDQEDKQMESTGGLFIAVLDIVLDILMRCKTSASPVEEFNDLLADISLCVNQNRFLGGAVSYAEIVRIEAPAYDFDSNTASAMMFLRVTYEHEANTI